MAISSLWISLDPGSVQSNAK